MKPPSRDFQRSTRRRLPYFAGTVKLLESPGKAGGPPNRNYGKTILYNAHEAKVRQAPRNLFPLLLKGLTSVAIGIHVLFSLLAMTFVKYAGQLVYQVWRALSLPKFSRRHPGQRKHQTALQGHSGQRPGLPITTALIRLPESHNLLKSIA